MTDGGLCLLIFLPFPLNSVPLSFETFFKLEYFSPAASTWCAHIKVGNSGRPVGESCRYLVGKFLRRQSEPLGCRPVGESVGWVAEVFLHPGQLQDQHCQGDQTHQRTLTF